MTSFLNRVIGALRLRAAVFEEVEHDRTATGQAAAVVALSAVAGGLVDGGGVGAWPTLLLAFLFVLLGWGLSSWIVLQVGTKLLPGRNTDSNLGEILRTTAFAQAPGIVGAAAAVPVIGGLIGVVVSVWTLVALVIAVRQALDYEQTWKAVLVCIVVWLATFGALSIAGLLASHWAA